MASWDFSCYFQTPWLVVLKGSGIVNFASWRKKGNLIIGCIGFSNSNCICIFIKSFSSLISLSACFLNFATVVWIMHEKQCSISNTCLCYDSCIKIQRLGGAYCITICCFLIYIALLELWFIDSRSYYCSIKAASCEINFHDSLFSLLFSTSI